MSWRHPKGHNRAILGSLPPRGDSSIEGQCSGGKGSCRSGCPVFLVGEWCLVSGGTGNSKLPMWQGISKGSWQAERPRRRGSV